MIFQRKRCSTDNKRRAGRLRGFTLIEIMVALTIIGIGTTAALSVYSAMLKNATYDSRFEKGVESAEEYLANLYLSTNLAADLFDASELSNLMSRPQLPVRLSPVQSSPENGIVLLVNKNVRRWQPLLVDVGIEVIIRYDETNRPDRHYWMETTFSEAYLGKLN